MQQFTHLHTYAQEKINVQPRSLVTPVSLSIDARLRGRIPCARILFVHIPKTGGESVKATLRKSFPTYAFNFLDHRSYDWRSLINKKLRRARRKRREISSSSITFRAKPLETFGEICEDYKVYGRKKVRSFFRRGYSRE